MVLALNQIGRAVRHVVTQVIKAEFVVCTVGDIGLVCAFAFCAVGTVVFQTINAEAQEVEYRGIPLGVTTSQLIVYGYQMHASTA